MCAGIPCAPDCANASCARRAVCATPCMAPVRLRARVYWCLWSWPRKWGELEAVLQCTAAEAVSSSRDHLVICSVEAASKQEASRSKAKRWCSYIEAVRGRLVGFRCRRRRRATNARWRLMNNRQGFIFEAWLWRHQRAAKFLRNKKQTARWSVLHSP